MAHLHRALAPAAWDNAHAALQGAERSSSVSSEVSAGARAQGMAMGAQENIVDSVHIFIAIAAHKGLAAYALGSSVVDSQARRHRVGVG